jgi:hypothetical protein
MIGMYRCTLRVTEQDGTTKDSRAIFYGGVPEPGRVLTLDKKGRKIRVSGVSRFEHLGVVMTAEALPR